MKEYSIFPWTVVAAMIIFSACERVIDVDLNSSNPALVAEGGISNVGMDTIRLSRTVNYDEKNIFPPVIEAALTVTDDLGNSMLLPEVLPGLYFSSEIYGEPSRKYTLEIITENEIFSSVSEMPYPAEVDSVFLDNGIFGSKYLKVMFHDSAGIENYYRILHFVNGIQDRSIEISTDILQDGQDMTYFIYKGRDEVSQGDTISVFLQSIDKPVYEYFRTLSMSLGGGGSTAPANPISNISDNALGYFSAYSLRSKTMIVP
jgi:hypothetical protein